MAGFWLLLALAYVVDPARWADESALWGFVSLRGPLTAPLLEGGAHLADPLPYGLAGAAIVIVALARRCPLHALAAAVLLGGSAVSSQVLKPLLAMERPVDFAEVSAASYPSGHATAAMALALAAVLVTAPAWRRHVAVAGGAFALLVSFSVLALGWHFPSDVVGGYLLAGVWCLLAVAALRALAARVPQAHAPSARRAPDPRAVKAVAGSAGIAVAVAGAALAPEAADYAQHHTTAAAVAMAIAASAAVVLAAVTAATGR